MSSALWTVTMCGCVSDRDRLRLAAEALAAARVGGDVVGDDLQRDVAIEAGVVGPVDLAHAAGADEPPELVGAELGSRD